tara:strand:- start:952 stop:1866 length:915 start_codon:yes stop_codon:yes gene_type:complete
MTKHLTLLLFIGLAFWGCANGNIASDKEWNSKGDIENEDAVTILHNGITREYILYVPEIYSDNFPVPLLINFHGGGGTATGQMYVADMRPIADTANFILVYPQGLELDNGGSTHWNSMLFSDSNKSSVDDFGFIDALIDDLLLTYNIDSTRLYATGFSNGADMSFTLGCYLQNKIAAVAPVSGLMLNNPNSNCSLSIPTGIMIVHGTSDSSRPIEGIGGYYASINETIEFWASQNGMLLNPSVTNYISDGFTIELHSYPDQENTIYIDYYKVINGDHIWLDIARNGLETNQVIWNFLSRFSLNL